MPADFSPTFTGYTRQGAFRYWCQMVMPLVYDDSLSYYELLNKVVTYLNNVISDVSNVETNLDALKDAYEELEHYVNEYFDNLDVQNEINDKLDEMAATGELAEIIDPYLPDIVGAWLEENLTPTSPPVDPTLTIPNAAADAKTVGDRLNTLEGDLDTLDTNAVQFKGIGTATADLNTFTEPGIWFMPYGEKTNAPYDIVSAHRLVNIAMNGTAITQLVYADQNTYFRTGAKTTDGYTFQEWVHLSNNEDAFTFRERLGADVDLNTIYSPGYYIVYNNNTLVNSPTKNAGRILVFSRKRFNENPQYVLQIYADLQTNNIYYRTKYLNSSDWGNWIKFLNKNDYDELNSSINDLILENENDVTFRPQIAQGFNFNTLYQAGYYYMSGGRNTYNGVNNAAAKIVCFSRPATGAVGGTQLWFDLVNNQLWYRTNTGVVTGNNMLLDTDAPSLTAVNAQYGRYYSQANSLETNGAGTMWTELPDFPVHGLRYGNKFVCTTLGGQPHLVGFYQTSDIELEQNGVYTLSMYARGPVGANIRADVLNPSGGTGETWITPQELPLLSNDWQRYDFTFRYNGTTQNTRVYLGSAYDTVGTIWCCGFTLVPGEVGADWTPNVNEPDAANYMWKPWKKILDTDGNEEIFTFRERIENGTDINDLTTPGYYIMYGNTTVEHGVNSHNTRLLVFAHNTEQYVTQMWFDLNTNEYYYRTKRLLTDEWKPWVKVVTEPITEYTPAELVAAFVRKTNDLADEIGMDALTYTNPSGGAADRACCMDMITLLTVAASYNKLAKVWGKKTHKFFIPNRPNDTSISPDGSYTIETTVTNDVFETSYRILGGKPGIIDNTSYTLLVIAADENDNAFCGVIMGAANKNQRWTAMKQLFDIGVAKYYDDTIDTSSMDIDSNSGVIWKLPNYNTSMCEQQVYTPLFSKNENTIYSTASTIKVLTMISALNYITNLDEKITLVSADIKGGTGLPLMAGDIITVRDLIYLTMLISDNSAAYALARHAGKLMIKAESVSS